MRTVSRFTTVVVAKGQELFAAGDLRTAFFRVEKGLIHLVASDHRGEEATLELVGPGGTIGELSLAAHTRSPHSAIALLPTSLTRVDSTLTPEPRGLLPAVLAVLSARVRVQQDTVVRDQRRHVSPRLASLLLDLAVLSPGASHVVPWVPRGLTQADLASVLASSRESVSRGFTEFERRAWIRRTPDGLLITAEAPLRAHADIASCGHVRVELLKNARDRQAVLAGLLGLGGRADEARAPVLYSPLSA